MYFPIILRNVEVKQDSEEFTTETNEIVQKNINIFFPVSEKYGDFNIMYNIIP